MLVRRQPGPSVRCGRHTKQLNTCAPDQRVAPRSHLTVEFSAACLGGKRTTGLAARANGGLGDYALLAAFCSNKAF